MAYKVKLSTNYEKIIDKFVIPFIAHARPSTSLAILRKMYKDKDLVYVVNVKDIFCECVK